MGQYDGSLQAEFSITRGIFMAEIGKCMMLTATQREVCSQMYKFIFKMKGKVSMSKWEALEIKWVERSDSTQFSCT